MLPTQMHLHALLHNESRDAFGTRLWGRLGIHNQRVCMGGRNQRWATCTVPTHQVPVPVSAGGGAVPRPPAQGLGCGAAHPGAAPPRPATLKVGCSSTRRRPHSLRRSKSSQPMNQPVNQSIILTGDGSVCDPHLGAVEHVAIPPLLCTSAATSAPMRGGERQSTSSAGLAAIGCGACRQPATAGSAPHGTPAAQAALPPPAPPAQKRVPISLLHTHARPAQPSLLCPPARHRMLTTSEPALGSLIASAPTCSPVVGQHEGALKGRDGRSRRSGSAPGQPPTRRPARAACAKHTGRHRVGCWACAATCHGAQKSLNEPYNHTTNPWVICTVPVSSFGRKRSSCCWLACRVS